ncbi:MAG: type II secretion system F family protein [Clostridia bacterium]|jgi:tight adherence protein C|nr:type II secretion system F family protein [Clostridia bacterium]
MKKRSENHPYGTYQKLLDNGDYSLPYLLPLGLWLLKNLRWRGTGSWNKRIRGQLTELYSARSLDDYLRLHYAFKTVYFLAGLGITGFLTIVTGDFLVLLFCLGLSVLLFFLPDYEVNKKVKARRAQLAAEFPDFLHKVTLLLGAGMTIPRAWEKIVQESKGDTPLQRELHKSMLEIEAGSSILQAYEGFARRCRLPEINKFVTLISQNMKKGNAELVFILRMQAAECWDARKLSARRLGEEAATKLLFPLLLMLVAVLLIVMAPAALALQGL